MIKSRTFKIIVIADSGIGIKFERTIPRPEILLTDAWLGTRKKKTVAAMIATATVKISVSFDQFRVVYLLRHFQYSLRYFIKLRYPLLHDDA